ncbi:MAG: DUF4397 domain-containing protein [Cytophagales bacterium]|nr:MAG: DUF4397 domain-containing protein [Cytophagales bacterium]
MLFKKSITYFLGSAALLATVLGCGDENDILRNQVPAAGTARVKILHTVVGGPAVDVFANDAKITGVSLAYGAAFPTEYVALTPGTPNFRVATPTSGSVTGATILTAPLALEADKYYTLAATGTAAAPAGVLIPDDLSLPAPGKNYVRVLNLLTTGQSIDLAIGTSAPLVSNVAPRTASAYVALDPNAATAAYAFQARPTSTTTSLGGITYNSLVVGRKVTVVVRGAVGSAAPNAPAFAIVTNK